MCNFLKPKVSNKVLALISSLAEDESWQGDFVDVERTAMLKAIEVYLTELELHDIGLPGRKDIAWFLNSAG